MIPGRNFCRNLYLILYRLENINMADLLERIPVDDDYLVALGRATYNFAYLEWGIIWLADTLQPEFLHNAEGKTAGQIAEEFCSIVKGLDNADRDKVQLQRIADDFHKIIADRNSLMHSNPYTAYPDEEQRLLYSNKPRREDWTIEKMKDFSCRTADMSIKAGELLHNGRLQQYHATKSG